MKAKISFIIFIAISLYCEIAAQGINSTSEVTGTFVRNDGQIIDTDGNIRPDLLYYGTIGEKQVYFANDKACFVWAKMGDTLQNISDSIGRMDLEFQNIGNNSYILAENQEQGLMHYYKPHLPNGIENVPSFGNITYKNLYPNTDVKVKNNNGRFEMEVTFHPGADPSNFKFKFNGADNLELETDGKLKIERPLGTSRLDKPNGKKINGGGGEIPVTVDLVKDGNNVISISISNFQAGVKHQIVIGENRNLPILPITNFNMLYWSTYYSGNNTIFEDHCYGTHIDASDNIYFTGYTYASDFPPFLNVQNYIAGADAYVVKFNTQRKRVFSTFYGGSDDDYGYDVKTNTAGGGVYITGSTQSPDIFNLPWAGFPFTSLNGTTDAFVASFTSTGTYIFSMYLGGNGTDFGSSIAFDQQNNMYVVGESGGATGYPVQPQAGAFNQSSDGTGFIVKIDLFFSSLIWVTQFNGNIQRCLVNNNNELIIAGRTNFGGTLTCSPTTNFSLCDPGNGAYVSNIKGGYDYFISRFSNTGVLQWSTLFGGTNNEGSSNSSGTARISITVDNSDNLYIAGTTRSGDLDDLPFVGNSNALYEPDYLLGITDGFIAKFSNNGNQLWTTYYGGSNDDEITGISIIGNELFFAGMTKSLDIDTKLQPGSYNQNSLVGSRNGFVGMLKNGEPKWTTYFGGNDDYPEALAASGSHLILAGRTNGSLPTKDIPGTIDYFNGFAPSHGSSFFTDFKEGSVNISGPKSYFAIDSTSQDIKIYPNPSIGDLIIENALEYSIKILTLLGQEINAQNLTSNYESINLNHLSNGMYIVEFEKFGLKKQMKLIIE